MNWDQAKGKWNSMRGQVRQRWGKLTDDDIDRIEGRREELAGKLQERYGWTRDRIDEELRSFESSVDNERATSGRRS